MTKIDECYLIDRPEYLEGFVHRVMRCGPEWAETLERAGWNDLGPGSRAGYRVVCSGGSLYEVRPVEYAAATVEGAR